MTIRALAVALALAGAARAEAPALTELAPGRYEVALSGMLCAVCTRAIAAEWSKLPAVEKVSIDLEKETAVVTVKLGKPLKVSALRKALRRAERTANMDARFEASGIRYIP